GDSGRVRPLGRKPRHDLRAGSGRDPVMPIKAKDHRAERDRLFYNLLPGERARLREFQGNRDPITGAPLSEHAHVDHDHKTGLIRGLLNPLTNKFLIDDVEILQASIDYLKNPPAV